MAFLRRGNVKVPHKQAAFIRLTRIDGTPITFLLKDINCWEEYQVSQTLGKLVMVSHFLSSTAVRESFDSIDAEINGKAVAS